MRPDREMQKAVRNALKTFSPDTKVDVKETKKAIRELKRVRLTATR